MKFLLLTLACLALSFSFADAAAASPDDTYGTCLQECGCSGKTVFNYVVQLKRRLLNIGSDFNDACPTTEARSCAYGCGCNSLALRFPTMAKRDLSFWSDPLGGSYSSLSNLAEQTVGCEDFCDASQQSQAFSFQSWSGSTRMYYLSFPASGLYSYERSGSYYTKVFSYFPGPSYSSSSSSAESLYSWVNSQRWDFDYDSCISGCQAMDYCHGDGCGMCNANNTASCVGGMFTYEASYQAPLPARRLLTFPDSGASSMTAATCTCNMEYTGMYCNEDVEGYCSGIACDMGTCTDSVCVCDEGYEGASCDVNSDDCLGDPCGMYGNCTDGPSSFTCACESGYNGTLCNEDVDDCAAEPCGMYGSCTDAGANAFNCSCNMEYAGVTCTENADGYCGGIACGDMGTCSEENVCECMTGYTGASCDEDVDDCAADPCGMYGASCEDVGVNDFNCTCITGYQGELCDEDVDDCAADPCMYGTCSDDGSVVSQFNCTCDMGYAGDLCDENAAGYCAGSMCVEGTCTDDVCVCTSGWDGVNCDEDFDDCAANPCIEDLGFSDFLSSASTYEDIVLDDYFLCQDFGTNNYTCTLTVTVAANTMAPSIVSALLAAVVAFMAL